MSVPFPHEEDFVIQDMGFDPEWIAMYWKTTHILHRIVFEENILGSFPFFIQPVIHKSHDEQTVRRTNEYKYKIRFRLQLTPDQEIFGRISLFLQTFQNDPDDSDSERIPETNRMGIHFEIQMTDNGRMYSYFNDIMPQFCRQYPGQEKLFLKLWLSSPLYVIDNSRRNDRDARRYAFSDCETWHRIFIRKLDAAKEIIEEENNFQERIAGIMTEATRSYNYQLAPLSELTHNPHYMHMLLHQIRVANDVKIERLIRNRET